MRITRALFYLFFPFATYFWVFFMVLSQLNIWTCPDEKQPYVSLNSHQSDAATSATITWESREPEKCALFYKASSDTKVKWLPDNSTQHMHTYHLENLDPDSEYHYRIECNHTNYSSENSSMVHSFRTFSGNSTNKKLILLSDTQVNPVGISHMPIVMRTISRMIPEYIPMIIAGDVCHVYDHQKLWDYFFNKADPVLQSKSIFTVPGNHDCVNTSTEACIYSKYFVPASSPDVFKGYGHWLQYGNDTIIIGYTDYDETPTEYWRKLTNWIEETLERFKNVPIKIVVGHRPFFYKEKLPEREGPFLDLFRIFDKYKVAVLLNGHLHTYRRLNIHSDLTNHSMVNVITGGGGGTLESLLYSDAIVWSNFTATIQSQNPAPSFSVLEISSSRTVSIKAFSIAGNLIDEVLFTVDSNGDITYHKALVEEKHMVAVSPSAVLFNLAYINVSMIALYLFACFITKDENCLENFKEYLSQRVASVMPQDERALPINESLIGTIELHEKIRRKAVYSFLLPRILISPASSFFTVLFACTLHSFIAVTFFGMYSYENNSQYLSTFRVALTASFYFWLFVNSIECNLVRIFINIGQLTAFLYAQIWKQTTFDVFEEDTAISASLIIVVGCGIILEVMLPAASLELLLSRINNKTLLNFWITLFCPFDWKLKFARNLTVLAVLSLVFMVEFALCWSGLSISEALSLGFIFS